MGQLLTTATEYSATDQRAGSLESVLKLAFAPETDPKVAQTVTWQLAHTHYENFSVVSALLPRHLRQDFCNVYAFCRVADDLSDEVGDKAESLRLLERLRQETQSLYAGALRSAVFSALSETVARHNIPISPFLDLIDAFEQDQRIDRYDTFEQLCDYCRRSADPVGRLVLYMCGYSDASRQRLSDRTCTALQLANFWQDVRGDILDRDRVYLPRETMAQFGVTEEQLRAGRFDDNYRNCIRFEVDRTETMFDEGDVLLPLLDQNVRPQIALFGQGGRAILQAIRKQDYNTLTTRPSLSRWQKGRLVFGAMARAPQAGARAGAAGMNLLSADVIHASLARSRTYCEQLTRSQAKNFYYGLKLLPEPKRSAMFALYAYMRLVDDIADDENGRSVRQRLDELQAWREQTHAILDGGSGVDDDHPLWPAFTEMVHEYRMPRHIFDDVIAGQKQDLEPEPFDTFAQLHEYCYRVAGVVGLASIYIWGFEGGADTQSLAIDRGLAFQLTNILRDLREDAARGRTYLPREELAAMNVTEEDLRTSRGGKAFGDLMRFQIELAEGYYLSSQPLEDRIQRDSRPTLIAMTQIYHRLLKKVATEPERVLRERVSLSLISKLMIGWRAARSRH